MSIEVGEVIFATQTQDLTMQLHDLGGIDLVGISTYGISQFLRQSKCANGVLKEVGGAVEVREHNDFGLDVTEKKQMESKEEEN